MKDPALEKYNFLRSATLYKRVKKSGKGYVEDLFRFKQLDGNEYLYCMKDYADRTPDTNVNETDQIKESSVDSLYADIWRSLIWHGDLKFFWKDKDRRFLGASRSFLDFFGLDSADDIIGKTDEDVGWHMDNDPYTKREIEVINNGITLVDDPGKCIVKGNVKDIYANKVPLYEGDDIAGLVGYFVDGDEKLTMLQGIERSAKSDPVTGLMNSHAFVDAMIDFADIYNDKGADYGLIVVNNTRQSRIIETYGNDFSNRVLKVAAEKIIEMTGNSCAVARPKGALFAVIKGISDPGEIHELAEKILNELKQINEVDGNSITIRVKVAAKARSESRVPDEGMYEWAMKEVTR